VIPKKVGVNVFDPENTLVIFPPVVGGEAEKKSLGVTAVYPDGDASIDKVPSGIPPCGLQMLLTNSAGIIILNRIKLNYLC
jgi:hypothetical protein